MIAGTRTGPGGPAFAQQALNPQIALDTTAPGRRDFGPERGPMDTHATLDESKGRTMQGVKVVDHPLVQHKLSLMRDKRRSTKGFRQLLNEIGMLLAYEVTRDLPLETIEIETPLTTMQAPQIAGKKLVLAPILRAGVGFLDGMLSLVPSARVAHIGLYRDPESLQAVEYYFKAPSDLADRMVLVLDPMLATANSAVAAIDRLKERGAKDLRFVCLLAAPEGIERFRGTHPDVPIWTAAIDERLNDHGYIVPGLGDAGDRMYGTR
jgi:uracil phosphoribosyltransferase